MWTRDQSKSSAIKLTINDSFSGSIAHVEASNILTRLDLLNKLSSSNHPAAYSIILVRHSEKPKANNRRDFESIQQFSFGSLLLSRNSLVHVEGFEPSNKIFFLCRIGNFSFRLCRRNCHSASIFSFSIQFSSLMLDIGLADSSVYLILEASLTLIVIMQPLKAMMLQSM